MKKGRHRRFEEARDLKRAVSTDEESTGEPCPECGAEPGKEHASWCLATEDDDYSTTKTRNRPNTTASTTRATAASSEAAVLRQPVLGQPDWAARLSQPD